MNVFLIGNSDSNKEFFAQKIADKFKLNIIHAQKWIDDICEPVEDRQDKTLQQIGTEIEVAAKLSIEDNPNACVEYVLSKIDVSCRNLIVGIRDPYDLFKLYDRGEDLVIYLDHVYCSAWHTRQIVSSMKNYLDLISNYIEYALVDNMMSPNRTKKVGFYVHDVKKVDGRMLPPEGKYDFKSYYSGCVLDDVLKFIGEFV